MTVSKEMAALDALLTKAVQSDEMTDSEADALYAYFANLEERAS